MAETNQLPVNSNRMDEIEYDWTGIVYEDVIMTYSEMGWELNEEIKEVKMSYDYEWSYFYYTIAFPDIYERIRTLKDNAEFSYAILSLIKNIDTNCKLYMGFVKKLYKGLKEYELFDVINMIGKEQKKKVFIAMSFDDSMNMARKVIMDAVQSCGC